MWRAAEPAVTARAPASQLARRLVAEFTGSALLVAVVVGSGIAAETLSPADVGIQLLENSLATALGLGVLILTFGPVSGAHFNPLVSLADWLLGRRSGAGLDGRTVCLYTLVQVPGAIVGALLANAMGRMFSDTFAGIAPMSVAPFIAAQIVGAMVGLAVTVYLYPDAGRTADQVVIAHPASAAPNTSPTEST